MIFVFFNPFGKKLDDVEKSVVQVYCYNEKGNINGVNKKRVSSGLNINKNENNKKLMYNFIGKVKLHM